MYKFNKIKSTAEVTRLRFAQAYYKVTDPTEVELAEFGDELLEKMIGACKGQDIVLVRIYWDSFVKVFETLNHSNIVI